MERALQVLKMRGVHHGDQVYPIKIGKNGIEILHPRLTPP